VLYPPHYRYSQELSSEGWQGLRTRLISLHVRFYGAVLLILLISITFYSRYVVCSVVYRL
jgi:hypothetical protein